MKTIICAVFTLAFAYTAHAGVPNYSITGSIAGADGGWDYASIDAETNQLYVARSTAVMAVDLASGKVTDVLTPAQKAHAVLPIPGSGALLETDGTTGTARLIDAKTGAQRWSVATGDKPDAAIWDAWNKRAIVMNNKGGTIALIDTATGKVTLTLSAKLKPGLEYAAIDKRGLVWVNNEEENTITPFIPSTKAVLTPIKLMGCEGATGLAYAAKHDRLVAVCGNGVAVVIDALGRKQVQMIKIGKGADAALIDAKRGVVAIPCGDDGVLEILDTNERIVRHVSTIQTEKSARTGAIDPTTGKIYLPAARYTPAEKAGERPKMVPGSFHVIILSPTAG